MSSTEPRFERDLEVSGRPYRVVDVWRGESGFGILHFVDAATADGTADRRALVTPEIQLDSLDDPVLRDLFEAGSVLTETERRFTAPDGRRWLAQNRGPVWAGRAAAEGHTGVRFTSLEGSYETLAAPAGHVGEMADAELEELWQAASRSAREEKPAPGDDGRS